MNVRDKMLAVLAELNLEVVEREEAIHYLAITLLTRKNMFILGDTGQAKSYVINLLCKRITGAGLFERLISKQTDEEMLFGRLDLNSLIPGKVSGEVLKNHHEYQQLLQEVNINYRSWIASASCSGSEQKLNELLDRLELSLRCIAEMEGHKPCLITAGKIPEADIVFLDELFKGNDVSLNALLTVLNERKYTNEGTTMDIPAVSFISASNEIPDFNNPEDAILRPLYDRFDLKIVTHYVEDRQNRLDMLKKKQQKVSVNVQTTTFTLDDLKQMQHEVTGVDISDQVNELMDDILVELRKKGLHISDRKYFNYYPIVQAQAWLEGRTKADFLDLKVLKNYLWTRPDEIDTIVQVLDKFCTNPMQEKISEIMLLADDTFKQAYEGETNHRSFIKFRKEFVKVYEMLMGLTDKAVTVNDQNGMGNALNQLEDMSRKVHEKANLTYVPLSELKLLVA